MNDVRCLVVLSIVVLATSLPFINRAYFVDDYYFVTMAQGIREHPGRPYDFKSDDAGLGNVAWERGQLPRMVNPPLMHYYLAGVMSLFGEETWKLRASYILFSFISIFSMYFLGKRFMPDPFWPTLLMTVTPVYWLTSYSLLIDGPLLAFLLLSLLTFVIALEKKSLPLVFVSGLLMGLTVLVKYFGVLVIVLALAWQILDKDRRQWKEGYLSLLAFALVQVLWAVWNIQTYGEPHFTAALKRGMTSFAPLLLVQKSIVVASFIGGGLVYVFASWGMLWKISAKRLVGAVLFVIVLHSLFSSAKGGFNTMESFLLAFFITSALTFFMCVARLSKRQKDPNVMFLLLWLFVGIAELVIVMPWTAGRYLLSFLPAACFIFAMLIKQMKWEKEWKRLIGVTAIFSLFIAHADYVQANAAMKLAERVAERTPEIQKLAPKPFAQWHILSDTFDGSGFYMKPLGWKSALPGQTYRRGDLLLRAYYRKSSWWNVDETLKKFQPVWQIEMRSKNPIRVMDVPASAGFYASCWGALPWVVTSHPLERYELYQAVTE